MDEPVSVAAVVALVATAGCRADRPATPPSAARATPEPASAHAPADSAVAEGAEASDAAVPARSAEDVRHLLSRLTYGPRPGDVERVAALGVERWLESQLSPEGPDHAAETAVLPFASALGTPAEVVEHFAGDYRQDTSGFETVELVGTKHRVDVNRLLAYAQMAQIARQISADHQLYELMVEFWTNHFNVYARKGMIKVLAGHYVEAAIRPHALGRFEDLLLATARHPAMLIYLDNDGNVRPQPESGRRSRRKRRGLNENYARELLELHTVGVEAGYTQTDVIEVARILTGWGIQRKREKQRLEFEFDPKHHDDGDKVVLGVRFGPSAGNQGEAEGVALLKFLARHPATARHIAYKLCRRFVADEPPKSVVDAVATVFNATGGDVRAMLRAIVRSDAFWAPELRGAKVKTPSEFLAGALRALGASARTTPELVKTSAALGAPPLVQTVPTGYPDHASVWSSGSQLMARMQVATQLARNVVPGVRMDLSQSLATDDPAALVDRVNQLVFGGLGRPETLAIILERVRGVESPNDRRTVALALALGSPEFQYR